MSKVLTKEEAAAITLEFEDYAKKFLAEKGLGKNYAILFVQNIFSGKDLITRVGTEWDGTEGIGERFVKAFALGAMKIIENFAQQKKVKKYLPSNKIDNE